MRRLSATAVSGAVDDEDEEEDDELEDEDEDEEDEDELDDELPQLGVDTAVGAGTAAPGIDFNWFACDCASFRFASFSRSIASRAASFCAFLSGLCVIGSDGKSSAERALTMALLMAKPMPVPATRSP